MTNDQERRIYLAHCRRQFVGALYASGWRQARIARAMGISMCRVSQICQRSRHSPSYVIRKYRAMLTGPPHA